MRKRVNEKENTNLHEQVCKRVKAKEHANEYANVDEKENDTRGSSVLGPFNVQGSWALPCNSAWGDKDQWKLHLHVAFQSPNKI